jgi:hypothetical protein
MPQPISQKLAANFQRLAQAVARGDRIYLATIAANTGHSTYSLEILFLEALGLVRTGDYLGIP